MSLTLKAAQSFLKERGLTADLRTMRQAAKAGTLKARLIEDAPIQYYVTTETDAIEWASNRKRGNPEIKTLRRETLKKAGR